MNAAGFALGVALGNPALGILLSASAAPNRSRSQRYCVLPVNSVAPKNVSVSAKEFAFALKQAQEEQEWRFNNPSFSSGNKTEESIV